MKYIVSVIMIFTTLLFTSCADAGKNQEVKSGVEVTLDGSKSRADFFGEIKKYKWKQIKGTKVKLLDKKSVNPTFVAPVVKKKIKLVFRLTTVEKGGEISPWKTKDSVAVFVKPNEVTQHPPIAKITVSSSEINYDENVTFSALESSDVDGHIVSYSWLNEDNRVVSTKQKFTYKFSMVGEHTITLKVTDNEGLVGTTTQTVMVKAVLTSVTLELNTTTLKINDTTQAKVTAHYNDNSSKELTNTITWIISNKTVVSIDDKLEVKALRSGTSTIQAKVAEVTSTAVSLEVLSEDTTPPVITLNGDANLTLTQGQVYNELGATAHDDVDGNVSVNISGTVDTNTVGVYTLIYTATDSANNSVSKTRTVNIVHVEIVDNTPPMISLNGDKSITLTQGKPYKEYGATAFDDVDGSISVTTSGSVDTNMVGTYTITYTATDSAGNSATKTSTVNVLPKYGVVVSEGYGNTALLYGQAEFYVSLRSQPESNVTIPLLSSDTNEGDIIGEKELIFTPENWYETQTVSVTGKNKNLGDAQQQYKIILGKIVSADENYNDLDPDDVDMKFKVLSISEPDDKYDFVPTTEKKICLKVNTALHKRLTYNLVNVPTGMVHEVENIHSPCLVWKAPVSESGTTHNITIEVTDGSIRKEVSFEIHVADTTPLQSKIEGDSVTITEPNSNLKGFRVTRLDKSINLEDIKFRKVINPYLMDHGRNRISDIFIAEKKVVGKIKVTIPQLVGDNIKRDTTVALFGPLEHHGFVSYQASGSSCCNLLIPGRVELEDKFGIGFGHEFLGLESMNFNDSPKQKKIKQQKILKNNLFGVSCLPTYENNGSLNYAKQYCTVANNPDINITVKKFGSTSTSTRWSGTSIEEMVSWLIDAQKGFRELSLVYNNKFTVLLV